MIPTIEELRKGGQLLSPSATEIGDAKNLVKGPKGYLLERLDLEVFLPSLGMNLQREFVWTPLQQGEFITSILKGIKMPPMTIEYSVLTNRTTLRVIDGKQRLTTLINYLNNGNSLPIMGNEWTFDELPLEHQKVILNFHICAFRGVDMSDQELIQVFEYLNYTGTPQEASHLVNLKGALLEMIKE